jgi:hypothetical protein
MLRRVYAYVGQEYVYCALVDRAFQGVIGKDNRTLISSAIGSLTRFKEVVEDDKFPRYRAMVVAVRKGNMEVLKILADMCPGVPPSQEDVFRTAMVSPSLPLPILEWVWNNQKVYTASDPNNIFPGSVCLSGLKGTMERAIARMDMPIILFVLKQGWLTGELGGHIVAAFTVIIKHDRTDLLDQLYDGIELLDKVHEGDEYKRHKTATRDEQQKISEFHLPFRVAASLGNKEFFEWAWEKGYTRQLTPEVSIAAVNGHFDLVDWFIDKGFIWDACVQEHAIGEVGREAYRLIRLGTHFLDYNIRIPRIRAAILARPIMYGPRARSQHDYPSLGFHFETSIN